MGKYTVIYRDPDYIALEGLREAKQVALSANEAAVQASSDAAEAVMVAGEAKDEAEAAQAVVVPHADYVATLAAATSAPTTQNRISALIDGRLVEWVRQEGGPCLGGGWVPSGVGTLAHYNGDLAAFSSGIADDENFIAAGTYISDSLVTIPAAKYVSGAGRRKTLIERGNNGNAVRTLGGDPGTVIADLTVDNRRSANGFAGHAFSIGTDHTTVRGVSAIDYGQDAGGTGGGTGVLFSKGGEDRLTGLYFSQSEMYPNSDTATNVGWIYNNVDNSFAHDLYVYGAVNGIGYAHELKNKSRHNVLSSLISEYSKVALAFGQELADGEWGCEYNIASDVLGRSTAWGVQTGKARYNLFPSILHDREGCPGDPGPSASLGGLSSFNALPNVLSIGDVNRHGRTDGNRNFVGLYAHGAGDLFRFEATAAGNIIEIKHPGARTQIRTGIVNASVNGWSGANANVSYCLATGEFLGSLSGYWHHRLEPAGATYVSEHKQRIENADGVLVALATDATANRTTGLVHVFGGSSNRANWRHVANLADPALDSWRLRTGDADRYRFTPVGFWPEEDGALYAGRSANRFSQVFSVQFRPGAGAVIWTSGTGSPEGVVAASTGSLYTREDGGAGTTLYVKESSPSTVTGWVAK